MKISTQLDKQQRALVKSTMDEQRALVSLMGSIDPAQAALAKLDKQVEDLGKHLDSGRISQEQYNTALGKIDANYAKLEKTNTGFDKLRLGTRQAQENVLQLGNALSSGDWGSGVRAVTQLGAGAGAGAAGLLSILGPLALATAAVGGLAVAYYRGSEEQDSYNKSLILTGNYAGVSAGQLGDMARQVSATVGTTGQAAAVLATLAGSGKIAEGSFVDITQAAVSMQEATGKAVGDTVAEFAKLADDPVKASAALNEQYHYLTASVYSQIVALEEQGDHAGAVKLATEQYADAINERTPKILENLSFWEKGYNKVAQAADYLKNVGRSDINDDIEQAQRNLAQAQAGDVGFFQNKQVMVDYYAEKLRLLEKERAEKERLAKLDKESGEAELAAQRAIISFDARTKSTRSNAEKRKDELKDLEKEISEIRAANPADDRLSLTSIEAQKAAINAKYKDSKGATTQVDLTGFNSSKNSLTAILSEYKNYQKELDAAQKAGIISQESYASQREAIIEQQKGEVTNAYQAEIAALEAVRGKASTSAAQRIQLDQKIADARANMVKAEREADSELAILATNEEGRLRKQALAVQTYTSALEQQVKALRLQGVRSAEGLGLGDRQRSLQDQQNGITDRINQQKLDLANQYGDGSRGMSLDEYNQKLAALDKTQRDLQQTAITNYNDMSDAQGSWSAGASSAFQNYLESARDVAGQAKTLFTNAFSSMEDAVVNFAMTGKFSFADFTKSILADMARIATRQAASGLLSSIASTALGAWFGGGGAAPASTTASVGGSTTTFNPQLDTSGLTYQAKGGAWSEGVQFFANGGAFTNSIVSQPTAFSMAGGKTGVMGEAGEEAIMPLARTSGGQLGVRAIGGSGGGGGTAISISAPVSLTIPDRSDEGMELDQTLLQQNMQKQMRIAADKAVADSWRPGGVSYRNSQGRT